MLLRNPANIMAFDKMFKFILLTNKNAYEQRCLLLSFLKTYLFLPPLQIDGTPKYESTHKANILFLPLDENKALDKHRRETVYHGRSAKIKKQQKYLR